MNLVFTRYGKVVKASGYTVYVMGLNLSIGAICTIDSPKSKILAQVIGIDNDISILMSFDSVDEISVCSIVYESPHLKDFTFSDDLLGKVISVFGSPSVKAADVLPVAQGALGDKQSVSKIIDSGISPINGLLTLGEGQRIGVFAGSGVGKSVLLSSLTKNIDADICVCALIGERGREVVDFKEKTLQGGALSKAVIVSAPADASPLMKVRSTEYAIRIAEKYASEGKRVVFLFDSLTRYAHALREIGLAAGEPPTMKGYPPSIFQKIPKLVERCGNFEKGSITGVFTVLMDGDDENDPVVDTSRAILDGHIMLCRKLAGSGHYPAIDINKSVSRCMTDLVSSEHLAESQFIKSLVSVHKDNVDLVSMGAYQAGTNQTLDLALSKMPKIKSFLTQSPGEVRSFDQSKAQMSSVCR